MENKILTVQDLLFKLQAKNSVFTILGVIIMTIYTETIYVKELSMSALLNNPSSLKFFRLLIRELEINYVLWKPDKCSFWIYCDCSKSNGVHRLWLLIYTGDWVKKPQRVGIHITSQKLTAAGHQIKSIILKMLKLLNR
ncbi:hypothetical protein BDF20DRAFT_836904 [Mycotypha africana]|uniref:uncharacterized protein n=1 Tax=Mycotypha africana TaxID=64632 RepID=UPI0022FFD994|nr:uncharacterized protein BDF20DRAFT_836904 [Mycotypha africana]KAI8975513.1 hypothetical protein BDF20DRAFT_836904 [Mycotypha africana]